MVAPVSASSTLTSTASAAAAASRISAGGARALSTGAEEVGGAASTNAFTTGYENILYNDYGQRRRHGREGGQHPQHRRHPSDAASPNAPSRQRETQDGDFAVKLSEALRNRPPVIHDTEDASVNAYVAVSRSATADGGHGRGRLLDFSV